MSSETSYLRFGSDIVMKGGAQTTPLVDNNNLFYVNLIDIGVNGQHLKLPPETFALKSDGTGAALSTREPCSPISSGRHIML